MELGTIIVAEKVPVSDDVIVGGIVVIVAVSNFIVIGAFDT